VLANHHHGVALPLVPPDVAAKLFQLSVIVGGRLKDGVAIYGRGLLVFKSGPKFRLEVALQQNLVRRSGPQLGGELLPGQVGRWEVTGQLRPLLPAEPHARVLVLLLLSLIFYLTRPVQNQDPWRRKVIQ